MPTDHDFWLVCIAVWWGLGFLGRAVWKKAYGYESLLDFLDCLTTGLWFGPAVYLIGFIEDYKSRAAARREGKE